MWSILFEWSLLASFALMFWGVFTHDMVFLGLGFFGLWVLFSIDYINELKADFKRQQPITFKAYLLRKWEWWLEDTKEYLNSKTILYDAAAMVFVGCIGWFVSELQIDKAFKLLFFVGLLPLAGVIKDLADKSRKERVNAIIRALTYYLLLIPPAWGFWADATLTTKTSPFFWVNNFFFLAGFSFSLFLAFSVFRLFTLKQVFQAIRRELREIGGGHVKE